MILNETYTFYSCTKPAGCISPRRRNIFPVGVQRAQFGRRNYADAGVSRITVVVDGSIGDIEPIPKQLKKTCGCYGGTISADGYSHIPRLGYDQSKDGGG